MAFDKQFHLLDGDDIQFLQPVFLGHAEQSNIQNIGLAGMDMVDLFRGQLGGDEVFLNGVGVAAVIDLCQISFDIPAELLLLFHL